jgi:hypothetical protein
VRLGCCVDIQHFSSVFSNRKTRTDGGLLFFRYETGGFHCIGSGDPAGDMGWQRLSPKTKSKETKPKWCYSLRATSANRQRVLLLK